MAPSRGSTAPNRLALLAFFALQIAGLSFFCKGYFPMPKSTPGFTASTPKPQAFDKLVFVLIDALRSDFAFGPRSEMHFVKSLLVDGHGFGFTARAQAPTVTLPRLKALTTGANSAFLDAILNLREESSSSATFEHVDSWLWQLKHHYSKPPFRLVFLGDDTWLRLFPSHWFNFAEGVSSFYVSDTTTVDTNVTRHLPALFSNYSSTFDGLILHYLGLDHAGHLQGDSSPLMAEKQSELDSVIRTMYAYLEQSDALYGSKSLLVVCGDHGLTELGNHGGNSELETSSALLLASPNFQIDISSRKTWPLPVVQQVDFVPTLSTLFGIGIPRNSVGKVIVPVIRQAMGPLGVLSALRANSEQFAVLINNPSSDPAPSNIGDEDRLLEWLENAQKDLLNVLVESKVLPMAIGLGFLGVAAIGFVILALRVSDDYWSYCAAASMAYYSTMFASSFVEEEHEMWFFGLNTCLLLLLSAALSRRQGVNTVRYLALMLTLRLMRGWSRNGQKLFRDNSISRLLSTNISLMWILCGITLFSILKVKTVSSTLNRAPLLCNALDYLGLIQLVHFIIVRDPTASLPPLFDQMRTMASNYILLNAFTAARLLYISQITSIIIRRKSSFLYPLTIILISLCRLSTLPLFAIAIIQLHILYNLKLTSPPLATFILIALQYCSFYSSGGSSSLATVDLSQSFNGIDRYLPSAVVLLTFFSNFGLPLFWLVAAPIVFPDTQGARLALASAFYATSLLFLAISATFFRSHLFVFTGDSDSYHNSNLKVLTPFCSVFTRYAL